MGFGVFISFFTANLDVRAWLSEHTSVLGGLYVCVMYWGRCKYSAQLSPFHMEKPSKSNNLFLSLW